MKTIFFIVVLSVMTLPLVAQPVSVFEQLKENPQKAYGNDCPYPLTKPSSQKPRKVTNRFISVIMRGTARVIIGLTNFTKTLTRFFVRLTKKVF